MRIKWLAIVACSFLFFFPTFVLAQNREYKIKAEFLERFTRFIEWPADSTVSDLSSPFSICVIGKSPYGSYLEELADAVKIHKKEITLIEISSVDHAQGCNLLFISDSEKANLSAILTYTAHKPILTVSDSPGFAERGVLINFYEDAGFVRFEINTMSVQRSGLRFSSRLLKLGRLIDQETALKENPNALP